jgi:hypothetical protein
MANAMAKETNTMVATPNAMVEAPNTMVNTTNTMVKISRRYKFNIFNNLIGVFDHGL